MSEMPQQSGKGSFGSKPPVGGGTVGRRKAEDPNSLGAVIDTVESVLIALVLALTFRAFVAEAFVIPTGSMAPTLLGAHFDVICPKCGYAFKENADLNRQWDPKTGRGIEYLDGRGELMDSTTIFTPQYRLCPNCRERINVTDLPGKVDGSKPTTAWVNNGDRILVFKYIYSFLDPKRWDVIVFKEPQKAKDNFIKRLIGLPGDTVEIVGGDVFIDGEISRKPRNVQDSVWQLVYDNDHYPVDEGKVRWDGVAWTNPWVGQGATKEGWDIRGPVLTFGARKGLVAEIVAGPGRLQFAPTPPFDFYDCSINGYNQSYNLREWSTSIPPRAVASVFVPVGDLHLETVWTPGVADEDISVVLGPESNCYKVTWKGSGEMQLWGWNGKLKVFEQVAHPTMLVDVPRAGVRAYQLAMNNVDRQIQFFVDGKEVLNHVIRWGLEDAKALAVKQEEAPERPEMSLEVSGPCSLGHLKLMRDLYYSQFPQNPGTGIMNNPVTLGKDEFFVLGDNSNLSADSRAWQIVDPSLADLNLGVGRVPRRFLLGRAFFVYWPAGFRPMNGAVSLPGKLGLPLVPNTGEMRFIR